MDKQTVYSLTNYAIKNKSTENIFDVFNGWVDEEKVIISNIEEVVWIIEYIKTLQHTDVETINEALQIDKIKIEKENAYGKK